jgi:hypothetical protein
MWYLKKIVIIYYFFFDFDSYSFNTFFYILSFPQNNV